MNSQQKIMVGEEILQKKEPAGNPGCSDAAKAIVFVIASTGLAALSFTFGRDGESQPREAKNPAAQTGQLNPGDYTPGWHDAVISSQVLRQAQ